MVDVRFVSVGDGRQDQTVSLAFRSRGMGWSAQARLTHSVKCTAASAAAQSRHSHLDGEAPEVSFEELRDPVAPAGDMVGNPLSSSLPPLEFVRLLKPDTKELAVASSDDDVGCTVVSVDACESISDSEGP